MLQGIRNNLKGWVAGVIFGIISLTFMLWGVESYLEGHRGNTAVATVNGVDISQSQFSQRVRQLKYRLKQPVPQSELKNAVLQQMIGQLQVEQITKKTGFVMSPVQMTMQLSAIPAFQSDGKLSPQLIAQQAMNQGYSLSEFYQRLSNSLAQQQMRQGLVLSSFVLPNELNYQFERLAQKRDFVTVTVPLKSYEGQVKVTGKEVASYYQSHLAQFGVPAKARFDYLLLSPHELGQGVRITDQQAKQYYEANPERYRVPARFELERVLYKLPASPSEQEVKHSMALATKALPLLTSESWSTLQKQAVKGRVYTLQTVSEKQLSGKLLEVISNLKEGQLSQPIATREGVNVFRLKKRDPALTKSFDDVKAQIIKMLKHQKIASIFTEKSQALSNLVFTSPDSLEPAAKALGLTVKTSDWISQKEAATGVFADPNVKKLAFSSSVFVQHNNSSPISLKDASLLVVRFKDQKPKSVKTLLQVKQSITATLRQQKIVRLAGVSAYRFVQKLKKPGASAKALAASNDWSYKAYQGIERNNSTVASSVLKAVFGLRDQAGSAKAVQDSSGDYVIVQLQKVQLGKVSKASSKKLANLGRALAVGKGQSDYALYMAGARQLIPFKIHQAALKDAG